MSSEGARDDSERLPHAMPRSTLIQDDAPQIGRTHLSRAFKYLLIALPLPAISGFLGFWNLMTFFMRPGDRPRLCSLTPYYCDTFLSLPVLVVPGATLFTIATLFYLDRLLSVSPIFDPSKASVEVHHVGGTSTASSNLNGEDNRGEPSDPSQAVRRVLSVLRLSIVVAYTIGVLSALASSVATTNASLVAKFDSPWSDGPPDDKSKYQTRVIAGYAEAVFELLLAYYMRMTATALSGVKQAVGTMAPEGIEGREPLGARLARAWRRAVEGHWRRRSALDKATLSLLVSFTLSVVSFAFCITYYPFRHLKYVDEGYYIASCLLTPLFAWPALLVVHGHRSSGSLPGRASRLATFAALLLLATIWALVTFLYTVLCAWALFCDTRTSLPPTSPCLYVRSGGFWTGFVAVLLGYFQALCLGAAVVAVKRSGSGALHIEGSGEELQSGIP